MIMNCSVYKMLWSKRLCRVLFDIICIVRLGVVCLCCLESTLVIIVLLFLAKHSNVLVFKIRIGVFLFDTSMLVFCLSSRV